MKTITTIKKTDSEGTFSIYNSDDALIATAKENEDGTYTIFIYGSIAHGKIAKAQDWQDLNDKSVEISKFPRGEGIYK